MRNRRRFNSLRLLDGLYDKWMEGVNPRPGRETEEARNGCFLVGCFSIAGIIGLYYVLLSKPLSYLWNNPSVLAEWLPVAAIAFSISSSVYAIVNPGLAERIYNKYPIRAEFTALTHYVVVIFFLACVLAWRAASHLRSDFWIVFWLVAFFHGLRWILDSIESLLEGDYPSFWPDIFDTAANFSVVLLASSTIERKFDIYSIIALGLSAALISKEIFFRLWIDVHIRLGTRNEGRVFEIEAFQALIGRFIKSVAYITIGFALIYSNIRQIDSAKESFYIDRTRESGDRLTDFLYYSVALMHQNSYGDISPISILAKALSSLEQFVSVIMFGFVLVLTIEFLRRPDPARHKGRRLKPYVSKERLRRLAKPGKGPSPPN